MRRAVTILLCLLLVLSLGGCKKKQSGASAFYIYYRDQSRQELKRVEAVLDPTVDIDTKIWSVYEHMVSGPDEAGITSPVSEQASLIGMAIDKGNLVLNYSADYSEITKADEVLMRASLVLTFTQLSEIETVEIRVDGQPFMFKDGTVVGQQKSSDFTDVMSQGLNSYSMSEITVYYANETGDRLKKSTVEVTYNNSYSLEQYVAAMLVQGANDLTGGKRAFPEGTALIGVSTKNGVCQVSLSEAFLENDAPDVLPEVTIYSLVNTLTEINGISSVQILVNGSSDVTYLDQFDLSQPLKRNLDLVDETEE